MNCPEAQHNLPAYLDHEAAPTVRAACETHLAQCPVCRAELAELRSLSRDLSLLRRPVAPAGLAGAISRAVAIEAAVARQAKPKAPWAEYLANWLRPRLVPYAVGSFASLLLFFTAFAALRASLTALNDWGYAERVAVARDYRRINGVDFPGYDIDRPLTPEGLAQLRQPVGNESPTLNPKGALLSVMRSLAYDEVDDEMMVVADIFSDGRASLAGVMESPRDPRLLKDVQRALRKDAAFVPASYDNRPATIRVVFVVQSVGVREQ
jgi:anti-sigma factor RsiW